MLNFHSKEMNFGVDLLKESGNLLKIYVFHRLAIGLILDKKLMVNQRF